MTAMNLNTPSHLNQPNEPLPPPGIKASFHKGVKLCPNQPVTFDPASHPREAVEDDDQKATATAQQPSPLPLILSGVATVVSLAVAGFAFWSNQKTGKLLKEAEKKVSELESGAEAKFKTAFSELTDYVNVVAAGSVKSIFSVLETNNRGQEELIEKISVKTEKQAKALAELTKHLQKPIYEALPEIKTLAVKIPNLPEDDLTPISDFILKKMGYKDPNGKSWGVPIKPEFFKEIKKAVFEACNKNQPLSDKTYTIVEQLLKLNNTTLLDEKLPSLPDKDVVVDTLNTLLAEIGNTSNKLEADVFAQKVEPLLQLIIKGVQGEGEAVQSELLSQQSLLHELASKIIGAEELKSQEGISIIVDGAQANITEAVVAKLKELLPNDNDKGHSILTLFMKIFSANDREALDKILAREPNKEAIRTAVEDLLDNGSASTIDAQLATLVKALLEKPPGFFYNDDKIDT